MGIEENGIYNAELILLKVLEADSLLAGIDETSNQLSILKDQISQVQVSIQELVSLEGAFKGQGGQAIRAFYLDCHQPFLQFLETWIDEYQSYLKSFIGSLKALEPSPSGFIRQEFLEHELKQGLRNTLQITADLTQEANDIIKSVSDIVALPPLEDGRFIQAAKSAEDSSRETAEKLEHFDHRETAALDPLLQDLSHMNQYIQKIAGMFQSGSLSLTQYQPKSLNWKEFHEEISNPNPESGQGILQDIAEGAIGGASKAVGDTWDGLKSTYELGRTIMGPFSPLFLGSELLFNRDQLLENQRNHQEFYLGIINDPIGKVSQALDMPKYIWSAVTSAWERDVVNGDAKSRTAFFTYGLTSLGIGILGDKGIGKAGTIAKTVRQAGKGEKALPIYTPVQTPAVAGGLVQGPVPYNVLFDPLAKIKTVTDDVFGVKGTGKYQVGAYKDIKGVEGLDAHHVGQKAAMKKLVDNYDLNTAPAINVPKVGHTIKGPNGIVSRSTKGIDTPRQLLARDIRELRRVYDDIPNSTLKELIELNKKMYPEMRK
ncbi:LXG domain-containing protein [Cytobacillus firmus]|uniref:ribonuclease YeeF family protein n=1 Tax=Cytobacillus firmus TaxID=1399 RepID=UPI00218B067F|nr:LXG domain-containing protein [Cytobacillus firmus]URM33141.1 LXG domain-containing protein [Cytobacillus firmus]